MKPLTFALCLVLAIARSGKAELIEVTYTGTIGAVPGVLTNTFSVGDTFFGSYIFESTTPAVGGVPAGFAFYNAITSANVVFDTALQNQIQLSYAPSNPLPLGQEIQIDNFIGNPIPPNPERDRYAVVHRVSEGLSPLILPSSGAGGTNTVELLSFGFALFDTTSQNPFGSLDLPTNLDLNDFQFTSVVVGFEDNFGNIWGVGGSVNSISFSPVPEPSLVWLLGGFAPAGLLYRRRRLPT
ncbi:MAG: hypothetical protein NXI32_10210 [bacterium]|nr:hypothetical protein [bacterium]